MDQALRLIMLVECGIVLLPYLRLMWENAIIKRYKWVVRESAASLAIIQQVFTTIYRWHTPFMRWYDYLPLFWIAGLGIALYLTKRDRKFVRKSGKNYDREIL